MPFTPPHYVGHDMYDSGSCMQTKAEVAAKCKNSEFLSTWESLENTANQTIGGDALSHANFRAFGISISS